MPQYSLAINANSIRDTEDSIEHFIDNIPQQERNIPKEDLIKTLTENPETYVELFSVFSKKDNSDEYQFKELISKMIRYGIQSAFLFKVENNSYLTLYAYFNSSNYFNVKRTKYQRNSGGKDDNNNLNVPPDTLAEYGGKIFESLYRKSLKRNHLSIIDGMVYLNELTGQEKQFIGYEEALTILDNPLSNKIVGFILNNLKHKYYVVGDILISNILSSRAIEDVGIIISEPQSIQRVFDSEGELPQDNTRGQTVLLVDKERPECLCAVSVLTTTILGVKTQFIVVSPKKRGDEHVTQLSIQISSNSLDELD